MRKETRKKTPKYQEGDEFLERAGQEGEKIE
jgi:hypothetical protein